MDQLEKTYSTFVECICNMYGMPDAAEPLLQGYKALVEAQNGFNSHKFVPCVTEASLFSGDISTFLTAPVSVFITYKLYKTVIRSLAQILFGTRGENKDINKIISRIEQNPDEYRAELISELGAISKKPVEELDEDEVVELCTQLLEKHGEMCNGMPLLSSRLELKPDAKPIEPGSNNYELNQFKHYEGTGTDKDNPNAYFVRVYKDRAFDAIRTVPAMLIGLFSGLIMKNDMRVQYYLNSLKKLVTWSGSWRRTLDDIINESNECWPTGGISMNRNRVDAKHPSRFAAQWVKQNLPEEQHTWEQWNTILPKKDTRLSDAVGLSRLSDD